MQATLYFDSGECTALKIGSIFRNQTIAKQYQKLNPQIGFTPFPLHPLSSIEICSKRRVARFYHLASEKKF
jgi:hypothetical protein